MVTEVHASSYLLTAWCRYSSGGVVARLWMRRPGLDYQGNNIFSLPQSVLTGSEAHSTSYAVITGICVCGVKAAGREAYYSPLSSAKFKKHGDMLPLPHVSSCHSA